MRLGTVRHLKRHGDRTEVSEYYDFLNRYMNCGNMPRIAGLVPVRPSRNKNKRDIRWMDVVVSDVDS